MRIAPIRTELDYESALDRINALWGAPIGTEEGDELEILATLVEAFEEKHYAIEAPDPIEAIKFRMEQQGLTPNDMVPYLGNRSRVSDILNKKRKLNLAMIRKLASGLHIPIESLVQDYSIA